MMGKGFQIRDGVCRSDLHTKANWSESAREKAKGVWGFYGYGR